ncbi:hypothetical protein [Mesorhizobium sp. Pch-S]|uniref:hypothetical protein n=1 Tax=Mesorhizobium sp. Pch-S TaxID=2082387 RepID=UPI0010129A69|nr:hypothetical protein [Mesorhizobium sp. Pch-S]
MGLVLRWRGNHHGPSAHSTPRRPEPLALRGRAVGHSESGHNHILGSHGVTVMERTHNGMRVLHAILLEPVPLKQSAGAPHQEQTVEPGEYFITNNVEYNPFLEQARRVAD